MKRPRAYDVESGELSADIDITPSTEAHLNRFNPFGHPAPIQSKLKANTQKKKKTED